ncbi:MAG: hypothetical protein ACREBQ_10865, partial [Nitrososphaerales archaeon]
MRHPVTDIALLAYIAKKKADAISYTEATKACRSSSSASRALHQLIREGLIEPKPKLLGLRYVTQYVITPRGKQVSSLALRLSELRDVASRASLEKHAEPKLEEKTSTAPHEVDVMGPDRKPSV